MKIISEISRASKAVVEHLSDYHAFCDKKCNRPKLNTRSKNKEEGSQSCYRCKKRMRNCIIKSGMRIHHSRHQLDSNSRFMYSTHNKIK